MQLERYKKIKGNFLDCISFRKEDIFINENKLNKIHGNIPDFIDKDLDKLTLKMSSFYNEVKFPNYDSFDDYASLYDKGQKSLFTRKLDEELGYGTKILELGCGTGQLSLFLSRSNREICAIDISNSSLKIGEDFRLKNNIENTYFMKMDVFDLKFKPNTFDLSISNGVLHHTKNAEKAFKCIVEVTKPGGIIIIGLYHRYGRLSTLLKQKLTKLIGNKIAYLDKTSLKIKNKEKRKAWVKDQFMNPHEDLFTPNEVLPWLNNYGVDFLNLIPNFDITKERLFKKHKMPNIKFIDDLKMSLNSRQIDEGGFFVIIGKKRK